MGRQPNRNVHGQQFDQAAINAVWEKATIVPTHNPLLHRKDTCGAWMQKSSYGTTGDHGWKIDHIVPVSKGGSDALSNLQPLHWKNNRHKADNYPDWSCLVG